MKTTTFLSFTFFLGLSLNGFGQIITESFETDGEGIRYTSNSFSSGTNDYFSRMQDSQIPAPFGVSNIPGAEDGTFYWGAEDSDQATGGEGVLTISSFSVSGFINLECDILLAQGRANDGRFEPTDYLILEYNMDGGGWNIFGALYGNNDASLTGNLTTDTDLDGFHGPGGLEVNSTSFQNFNFSIPVTGTNMQVRVRALSSGGTEEILFDNIRISGSPTLPVELVNFGAEKLYDASLLSWQTASELNNTGFYVLHSTDGNHWDEVGFVKGAMTTTQMSSYDFQHRSASNGMNYYKLKQVDVDGTVAYSEVRSVRFNNPQAVTVTPNPNNGTFHVSVNQEIFGNQVTIEIMDTKGAQMNRQEFSIEANNTVMLNETKLMSGIYFVKVSDGFTTQMERVVVQ